MVLDIKTRAYRGQFTKMLWATKDTLEGHPPKAQCVKQRLCDRWGGQRAGKNTQTIHHVNNTKKFVDEINNTKLEEGECITNYDASALFTLFPVASAINII